VLVRYGILSGGKTDIELVHSHLISVPEKMFNTD